MKGKRRRGEETKRRSQALRRYVASWLHRFCKLMAVRRQTQVIAAVDGMAGRSMARVAKRYRRNVIGPLVGEIKKAKSPKGLLAQLGSGTVRQMDTTALEKTLANVAVQAGGVGFVSATPGKTSKSRNVETSKHEG